MNQDLLTELLTTCGVPGNEDAMREILTRELAPYGKITRTRWTGFYCAHKNNQAHRPAVVVTAHLDTPGFIVKEIKENGRLHLIPLGGLSGEKMQLRGVNLCTSGGEIFPGILHRQGEANGIQTDYEGFFGFENKEEARKKGVELGDSVCFRAPVTPLENDLLSAPHLDNRVGCYLLVEIARSLAEVDLPFNLYYAATSCEEMGGRGARILANMIEPAVAICLDVTYEEGEVKMGGGPVLTLSDRSVLLSSRVRDKILQVAKEKEIPLQMEVYNYAGTDAGSFKDVGEGCLTLALLLATLNNHSPYEIINTRDIELTRDLVVALCEEMTETFPRYFTDGEKSL